MTSIELRRITDEAGGQPCQELFGEYVAWVLEQFWVLHSVAYDEVLAERVNADFRDEWPKLFGARGRLYLALVDGLPAGVAGLKPVSATSAELKRVYVRPTHRGAGVARRLIEQVVTEGRALGYQTILLETADFMTQAHGLYRSVGFVGTERFAGAEGADHGVGDHELFMQLELTGPRAGGH